MPHLITIGLTTFNAIDTLDAALASALAQTWQPFEVIAVDDASTDGTLDKLRQLERQHQELRVFSNTVNSGVATSRNRVIAESRGEFLAFFDDDDVSAPTRVAAQYARIVDYEHNFAFGAPVICHTARRVLYPDGGCRVESTMGQREGRSAPAGPAVARRILMGEPLRDGYGACPTCSQMARLSTYQLVRGFEPAFRRGEDTDFNIRLAMAGGHYVGVREPLVTQNMTATAEKSLTEELRNSLILLERHRSLLEKWGQYNFCSRWLHAKHAFLTNRPIPFIKELSMLAAMDPLLTVRKLVLATPNLGLHRAFSRFHGRRDRST